MRLADLEKALKDLYKRELDLLKRIEVLENHQKRLLTVLINDAYKTNSDRDGGNGNSGSEPSENGINPS